MSTVPDAFREQPPIRAAPCSSPEQEDKAGDQLSTIPYSYAFQPIVNVTGRKVFSYEALIRGPGQEPAWHVLQQVPAELKYQFDRKSRASAVSLAGQLGISCLINLNYLPDSITQSVSAIEDTLAAAEQANIPPRQLVIEVTESEMVSDVSRFTSTLNEYRKLGIQTAIDDFGAGYSGLNLLAEFQPDQVKIDMQLVRDIQRNGPRQAIVRAVFQVCLDLGIDMIVEGVETIAEYQWLLDQGIELFQGYLFARPGFESLPSVNYPAS
ncbi:MAG: EAL domain-containing protein [Burkholderiaceae bacterium]